MRAAGGALGLGSVPRRPEVTADTLSVLLFPPGIDASLLPRITQHGVVVAGGLHPAVKATSFRVGHMGYAVTRPDYLRRTVTAIAEALREAGASVADPAAALKALDAALAVPA
jgi:alanine-glyoxylate transaminase/serine-glyoxylate transaminase/serine-pyruvate transaminase